MISEVIFTMEIPSTQLDYYCFLSLPPSSSFCIRPAFISIYHIKTLLFYQANSSRHERSSISDIVVIEILRYFLPIRIGSLRNSIVFFSICVCSANTVRQDFVFTACQKTKLLYKKKNKNVSILWIWRALFDFFPLSVGKGIVAVVIHTYTSKLEWANYTLLLAHQYELKNTNEATKKQQTNNDLVIGMELFHLTTCFINKVWRVCVYSLPPHFPNGAHVPVTVFSG